MRSTTLILASVLVLAIALGACGDDDPSTTAGPSTMEFLGQTNLGCTASRGGSMDCLEGATLTRMEALGDTVVFWIRFEANCCPAFTENVSYHGGELSIAVVDTVYGCRCICPFENAFRFLPGGSGPLHLLFESRVAHGGDDCLSGLDTTVVIP